MVDAVMVIQGADILTLIGFYVIVVVVLTYIKNN